MKLPGIESLDPPPNAAAVSAI